MKKHAFAAILAFVFMVSMTACTENSGESSNSSTASNTSSPSVSYESTPSQAAPSSEPAIPDVDDVTLKTNLDDYFVSDQEFDLLSCAEGMGFFEFPPMSVNSEDILALRYNYPEHTENDISIANMSFVGSLEILSVIFAQGGANGNRSEGFYANETSVLATRQDPADYTADDGFPIQITGKSGIRATEEQIIFAVYAMEHIVDYQWEDPFNGGIKI